MKCTWSRSRCWGSGIRFVPENHPLIDGAGSRGAGGFDYRRSRGSYLQIQQQEHQQQGSLFGWPNTEELPRSPRAEQSIKERTPSSGPRSPLGCRFAVLMVRHSALHEACMVIDHERVRHRGLCRFFARVNYLFNRFAVSQLSSWLLSCW